MIKLLRKRKQLLQTEELILTGTFYTLIIWFIIAHASCRSDRLITQILQRSEKWAENLFCTGKLTGTGKNKKESPHSIAAYSRIKQMRTRPKLWVDRLR